MTLKDDLKDIHRKCLDIERDPESGEPTGRICRKSHGHVKAKDPRRKAHFDPDHGGAIWGLDAEAMAE
jgi:hypothetical protein